MENLIQPSYVKDMDRARGTKTYAPVIQGLGVTRRSRGSFREADGKVSTGFRRARDAKAYAVRWMRRYAALSKVYVEPEETDVVLLSGI